MEFIRHHSYKYLFYSGIVNGVGDRFSQVAVLTLIIQLTGSGLAVGLALGVRILPYLILSPLGGRLADRWNKKKLMIATDLFRMPFALSFLFVESESQLWIIFAGMFALACGEAFYQPVRKSAIGQITAPSQLMNVNGLEQLLIGIVLIGGSITGGLVTFFFGNEVAFLLNAFSFLAAAILIQRIPLEDKQAAPSRPTLEKEPSTTFPSVIWMILLIVIAGTTMDGAFNVLISVYGAETYQWGELGVGLLYGSLGTGLVLSFFFTKFLKKGFLITAVLAVITEGILQAAASQLPAIWSVAIVFTGIALISGIGGACIDTVIMKRVDQNSQGTVFGIVEATSNIHLGIVMLLAGWLLEFYSERWIGFVAGGIGIGFGMLLLIGYYFFHKPRFVSTKTFKNHLNLPK
ncbi:MFS transporter [Halobacillus fulvus]|nr:MFS transporter [Halobacillus fulvus]